MSLKRLHFAIFAAELVGTFLLVLIGDGAIAAYVLTKQRPDVLATCLAFGVGAMVGTCAAYKISGAHLNPAVSLAFALDGRLAWRKLLVYMLAQYLGGLLAALVLYANYYEAIQWLDAGGRVTAGAPNATGTIFATYPAPYVSIWGALVDQVVGTGVLLFSLSAVTDQANIGLSASQQPLAIALTIALICVAFSPNCGAIFNPARDLAPRLATALVGYPATFASLNSLYWLVAGLIGPHLGAAAGVAVYRILISRNLPPNDGSAADDGQNMSAELELPKQQQQHKIKNHHHHHHHQQQQQQQQQQDATEPRLVSATGTVGRREILF